MTNKSRILSGKIKRIHVDQGDSSQFVTFTLEGDPAIHTLVGEYAHYDKLKLTAPGDQVVFEVEEEGWILKRAVIKGFTNRTLTAELGQTG